MSARQHRLRISRRRRNNDQNTVRIAHERGVAIGAHHPSFPDKPGFGRREMRIADRELELNLVKQIEILAEACARAGAKLRYVKPHGALYNLAARDRRTADVIAAAVRSVDATLVLLGLAGNAMLAAARDAGLTTASEASLIAATPTTVGLYLADNRALCWKSRRKLLLARCVSSRMESSARGTERS